MFWHCFGSVLARFGYCFGIITIPVHKSRGTGNVPGTVLVGTSTASNNKKSYSCIRDSCEFYRNNNNIHNCLIFFLRKIIAQKCSHFPCFKK